MKFAHMADCHLGGWHQPELNDLNFRSFQKAIDICIKEKVEFLLIAGDLFDSAYPSIETLKESFRQFRKLKEASIPVFIIAGSHDYSASGKTFLDVLERAGFCRNVSIFEEKDEKIILQPTIYKNVAIYGYPGKKSGLEVPEVERIKLQDSPLFKILMLHTTLRSAVPNPNVKAVEDFKIPEVDYLALGHLHINYNMNGKVYSGPVFPNNLPELEELQGGSFYIFNHGKISKYEIKINPVLVIDYTTSSTINATEEILKIFEKESMKDKIVILKVSGLLEQGKTSDINFKKLEDYCKNHKALVFLRNTSKLHMANYDLKFDSINTEDIEFEIIKKFRESRPSKFNPLINNLIRTLQVERLEDEKTANFEERLLEEAKRVVGI